ncbi:DUF4396 domain-containing protein [Thermostaphylospora chromogena]|uniref:DUF4396 domain-containing protein n=1 Tax=Thermostaphylospora chromogena TaxID=35622 RepID=A0A1H1H7X7_9ACTN|nr:DUF4396 domain-containing protein [Thermostaphylospora chromogena]SDR21572.1 protein of unknown function [Thermostaphylospora chromogena]
MTGPRRHAAHDRFRGGAPRHIPPDQHGSAEHTAHRPRGTRADLGTRGGPGGKATWRAAASATLHCLTGCAIGEVLGMVIGTALAWSQASTVILAVALAFFFGYLLTMLGLHRAGIGWRTGLRLALAADTVSILVMEVVDNAVMVAVPGAMDAGLTSSLFWGALAFSLLVAFVVTAPINKWLIGRGKGHAVIHAHHH